MNTTSLNPPFTDLAVQSYCFRGWKEHARLIEGVRALGLSGIELCRVHCDFNDESSFQRIIDQFREGGVQIVSIGVERITGSDRERSVFEFARQAGARYISVDFTPDTVPDAWRKAEKFAEEYEVRVAIHNHGGRHWLGSSAMLAHVLANTGPEIGLCLDTAWALDSREDPLAVAEKFKERLYGLHLKDFVFDRAGNPNDVVVGEGNLDLPGLAALLRKNGFSGYAVLEYEGDVDNPVPSLRQCVEALSKV